MTSYIFASIFFSSGLLGNKKYIKIKDQMWTDMLIYFAVNIFRTNAHLLTLPKQHEQTETQPHRQQERSLPEE